MPIRLSLKNVPVHFHPSTDTTLFKKSAFNEIKNRGLFLTDLNLIHCAMIHFQSRFKRSLSKRFQYTYLTIEPTLLEDNTHFYFDDGEKSELQTQSSEVIGVGFAIALFQRLFNVNFNCINEITTTGKRCDFEINFLGRRILAESKGRKSGLTQAINEIIEQKAAYPATTSKYGAISIIKRDVNPVEITVVDPPSEIYDISRNERILSLLIHYTKVAQLSGYSKLASLLNERIDEIIKDSSKIEYYEGKKVDYDNNVIKFGFEVFSSVGEYNFCTFYHGDERIDGFKFNVNNHLQLFFGLDNRIKEYLEEQNFEALLHFNGDYNVNTEMTYVSVHNDGTCVILIEKEKLEESKKNNKLTSFVDKYKLNINFNG
ncbi:hypothetical protein A8709_00610 [Paenibacillus pectinilyticus]|uniref:Uncharacterized protein n=1 Tax=Paenibacillus pectinilyticus TaxID=512399 RepID=A0A1C1A8B6_9BACL|nr:hypothetical protein [Paenibacillus pectinilyticus]OCT16850.1 hypothetical protein A8709_00610 [Paenibacillus pectinilyticus]